MSVQVNEFVYKPGENDEEYIRLLMDALERQKRITFKILDKMKRMSERTGMERCEYCRYCLDEDEYEHWCNGWGSPARLTGLSDYCSKWKKRGDE